jgi:DnaJ-domain-containing protein 1
MKRWYGKLFGVIAGALLVRGNPLFGALVGLIVGHAFDADWFRSSRDNPYGVLDIAEDANEAQIDLAYRRKISQYHPDRFAGAAPELRRQAEAKAREINSAYDRIMTLRKKRARRE